LGLVKDVCHDNVVVVVVDPDKFDGKLLKTNGRNHSGQTKGNCPILKKIVPMKIFSRPVHLLGIHFTNDWLSKIPILKNSYSVIVHSG
jgi:hypothetical protein